MCKNSWNLGQLCGLLNRAGNGCKSVANKHNSSSLNDEASRKRGAFKQLPLDCRFFGENDAVSLGNSMEEAPSPRSGDGRRENERVSLWVRNPWEGRWLAVHWNWFLKDFFKLILWTILFVLQILPFWGVLLSEGWPVSGGFTGFPTDFIIQIIPKDTALVPKHKALVPKDKSVAPSILGSTWLANRTLWL